MSTLITSGPSTLTPDVVEVFESSYTSGNIIHPILGRANPDVTLRPSSLGRGSLSIVFQNDADAAQALTLHRTGGVFTMTSSDEPTLNMSYVADGSITRALDTQTQAFWRVSVDFQEVTL